MPERCSAEDRGKNPFLVPERPRARPSVLGSTMAVVFRRRQANNTHVCFMFVLFALFLGVRSSSTGQGKKLYFNNDGLEPITRAQLGENLVLTCEAGGMPTPIIYWLYKSQPINQVSSFF